MISFAPALFGLGSSFVCLLLLCWLILDRHAHVKLLYTWLMHQEKLSSLFTTMSEVSAKKLCKEMEFRLLRGGEVVVNQGDKGNTCFVGLARSCSFRRQGVSH